jgi:DNA-binding CsgD family transcriptional regulator
MKNRRGRPPHDDLLTPAEWRTVHSVRHGLTNPKIADRRGISVDAVKFHVANAIEKLGVANRKALKSWQGAPRDSVLKSTEKSMKEEGGIIGIGQISRSVSDTAAAEQWYREVLGLDHLYILR